MAKQRDSAPPCPGSPRTAVSQPLQSGMCALRCSCSGAAGARRRERGRARKGQGAGTKDAAPPGERHGASTADDAAVCLPLCRSWKRRRETAAVPMGCRWSSVAADAQQRSKESRRRKGNRPVRPFSSSFLSPLSLFLSPVSPPLRSPSSSSSSSLSSSLSLSPLPPRILRAAGEAPLAPSC